MADREIQNNRAEQLESSRESSSMSALSIDLLQNNDLFRQLTKPDAMDPLGNNGFPELMLEDKQAKGDTTQMKSKFAGIKSPYADGTELITDRELRQAGLNPKDVKHQTLPKDKDGVTEESTSVKYPNGLEVTVKGRTKTSDHGNQVTLQPDPDVKLPQGFQRSKDDPNVILDKTGKSVATINDDGTVTVKVGKDFVNQGPAGIREATVIESRKNGGRITTISSGF